METTAISTRGDALYLFVCYAHDDEQSVFPDIQWLHDQNIALWYDQDISAGKPWRAEIAEAIQGAAKFLYYVSNNSLNSVHCNREIEYALSKNIEVIPIYLDDTELTPDLDMALNRVQALRQTRDGRHRQQLLEAYRGSMPLRELMGAVRPKRNVQHIVLTVLAIAALGAIGFWYWPVGQGVPSIALLPFTNLSADEQLDFYAEGMEQDIARELSKDDQVRVAARTSTSSTAYLVEGSIARSGDSVRVSIDLVRNEDGFRVWSEAYSESYDDAVIMQLTLAPNIALAVERMMTLDWTFDDTYATTDAEARRLFMTARRQWYEIHLGTGDWGVMVRNLERALAIEPEFKLVNGRPTADPYLGLALAYANRLGFAIGAGQAAPKARAAIDHALTLIPGDGYGYVTLAQINRDLEIDYVAAQRNIQKAIAAGVDPVTEDFHNAQLNLRRGQLDDALARLKSAEEAGAGADQPYVIGLQGLALAWDERYVEARQKFDQALTSAGVAVDLGVLLAKSAACHYQGDAVAANAALDRAWSILDGRDPGIGIANLGEGGYAGTFALLGRTEEARRILEVMEEQHTEGDFVNASPAFFGYYYLGEVDRALVWLQRAIDNREYWLFSPLQHAKYLEPLRRDIRLKRLMQEIRALESGELD